MKRVCLFLIIGLMSTLTAIPISAAVVASTDGFPGNTDIGYAPDDGFFGNLSFSFTTDDSEYEFNSVTLLLGSTFGSGEAGFFTVTLDEDNGGTPGIALELLAGSSDPTGSDTQYEYTSQSTIAANTTYWITLRDLGVPANGYDFWTANTTAEEAGSVWTIGDDLYGSVAGGFQGTQGPFISQFDATAIPEPSVIGLFFAAGGWLAFIRRR